MPRNLVAASSDKARFTIGTSSGDVAGPYTCAGVVKLGTLTASIAIFGMLTSASAQRWEWGIDFTVGQKVDTWDGSFSTVSPFTVFDTEGWVVLAITKASGTVTPRYHKYVFNTGVWTHADGNATTPNITAPGAGGFWSICDGLAGTFFNGDVAAFGYEPRQFTDSEIERLPAGQWSRWFTAFNPEFPPGSMSARTVARDQSRAANAQVSATGTTISTSGPPGFRYSRLTRRR